MKKQNTAVFNESMELGEVESNELMTYERRMKTYSVEALKKALPVDRIIVETPYLSQIMQAFVRIFQTAPEFSVPVGALLTGVTGVGKTAAFSYFSATLPKSSLFGPGDGAVYIRCRKGVRAGNLVSQLLKHYGYPFHSGNARQIEIRKSVLFDLVRQKGTRLVFIDEAQNLMKSRYLGSGAEGDTEATDFLRELMDTCKVGLVLAGPQVLNDLKDYDLALSDRLTTKLTLPPLDLNEEWVGAVAAISNAAKVDLSYLRANAQVVLLHKATAGGFRALKLLLIEVVLLMVHRNLAVCDAEVMRDAAKLVFGADSTGANVYA